MLASVAIELCKDLEREASDFTWLVVGWEQGGPVFMGSPRSSRGTLLAFVGATRAFKVGWHGVLIEIVHVNEYEPWLDSDEAKRFIESLGDELKHNMEDAVVLLDCYGSFVDVVSRVVQHARELER